MKYYYSISEVAEKTNVQPHVLRYWEQEFKELRPRKTRGGRRVYTAKDINLIFLIRNLLYEEHYTIKGACEKIRNNDKKNLNEIAEGLKEIFNILNG